MKCSVMDEFSVHKANVFITQTRGYTIATAHELEDCISDSSARNRGSGQGPLPHALYIHSTLLLTGTDRCVPLVAVVVALHQVPRALRLVNLLAVAWTQCLVVQCTPGLPSS